MPPCNQQHVGDAEDMTWLYGWDTLGCLISGLQPKVSHSLPRSLFKNSIEESFLICSSRHPSVSKYEILHSAERKARGGRIGAEELAHPCTPHDTFPAISEFQCGFMVWPA